MSVYVLMTKLGPRVLEDKRGRKQVGKEWKALVEKICPGIKFLSHYALLGPYDFMDIYEAKSDEDAIKVSLLSRASGALVAESWPAQPYDKYIELATAVEKAASEV
jgi:uncharacterized protein with GYD domain